MRRDGVAERGAPAPRVPLLVVDNYDSFTYNLVQYLEELGASCEVQRNDVVDMERIPGGCYWGAVISPGPGVPDGAGRSLDVVAACAGRIPVLGICLGHQVVAQHYGLRVERANAVVHGKASEIVHDGTGIFAGVPSPLGVGRYHSLTAFREEGWEGARRELRRTAWLARRDDGILEDGHPVEVMAVSQDEDRAYGVQFHPESVLTSHGKPMLRNFLQLCKEKRDG